VLLDDEGALRIVGRGGQVDGTVEAGGDPLDGDRLRRDGDRIGEERRDEDGEDGG
jgi:hypothetical protein